MFPRYDEPFFFSLGLRGCFFCFSSHISTGGVVSVVHQNEGLIWWGDAEERDREPLLGEDVARGGPLRMILKDESSVGLQANREVVILGDSSGEEKEGLALVKECIGGNLVRDPTEIEDSFNKLVSFSHFVGLPIDDFEEEILELLRRLELRKKRKVTR